MDRVSFEKSVRKVTEELVSMDKETFRTLLNEHKDGDIARLILHSGALEVGALEASNFSDEGVTGVSVEFSIDNFRPESIEVVSVDVTQNLTMSGLAYNPGIPITGDFIVNYTCMANGSSSSYPSDDRVCGDMYNSEEEGFEYQWAA